MDSKFKSKIPNSIFEVDVSNTLGTEYVCMLNEILRLLMIQIGIQLMLCMVDPEKFSVFSQDFTVLLLFIVIGVMFYYLVLQKIIVFK